MSTYGDVVWANGSSWVRENMTVAGGQDDKRWWYSVECGVYGRLQDLKKFNDFAWLVKNNQLYSLNPADFVPAAKPSPTHVGKETVEGVLHDIRPHVDRIIDSAICEAFTEGYSQGWENGSLCGREHEREAVATWLGREDNAVLLSGVTWLRRPDNAALLAGVAQAVKEGAHVHTGPDETPDDDTFSVDKPWKQSWKDACAWGQKVERQMVVAWLDEVAGCEEEAALIEEGEHVCEDHSDEILAREGRKNSALRESFARGRSYERENIVEHIKEWDYLSDDRATSNGIMTVLVHDIRHDKHLEER